MSSEAHVQDLIHRLEEGKWAKWVRLIALAAVCFVALLAFLFDPLQMKLFRGLSHAKAMEQAQIAREIAAGHGFSTLMIRPLAMAQLAKTYEQQGDSEQAQNEVAQRLHSDTYQAPLWPTTLAPFFKVLQSHWDMNQFIYLLDKVIITITILLFYLAVIVNFLTLRRLFDGQLAMLVTGLVLLCERFWSYALSGLPQMEMLLLFSLVLYTLVRAFEAQAAKTSPFKWLLAMAFLFGLLALAHAITLWIFLGALVITLIYFRPRVRIALAMGAIVLAMYGPWLVRNYRVCGSPFGVAGYSLLYQVRGTEAAIMRTMDINSLHTSPKFFRTKVQTGMEEEFSHLYQSLGGIIVAPFFFIALMHLFRKREVRAMRWALLVMWLFAVFGMALAGSDDGESPVAANDLNLLFIPFFAAYGLAFVLVLWNRLEIRIPYLRTVFLVLIFGISALPLINFFTADTRVAFWWPPYAPPSVARLHDWTEPNEVIASDMPWGVAWYANRKSLWIPKEMNDFIEINDYARLRQPIAGVFLTPVSGNAEFVADVLRGDYKGWAPLIMRRTNLSRFPFPKIRPMQIRGECVFFSDRERWIHDAPDKELMPEEKASGEPPKEGTATEGGNP